MAGRPTAYTERVHAAIVKSLEQGFTLAASASIAGVSGSAVMKWLAEGKESECMFTQFFHDVEAAREKGRIPLEATVLKHARDNPKIALAVLQRRWPGDWGTRDRVELTGAGGGPVQVQDVGSLASALDALATGADGDSGDRSE